MSNKQEKPPLKCLLGIDPEKAQKCKPSECASCGWEAAEAARRREYVKEHGLTLCADGFRRLITGRITRGLRITSSTIGHRNRADTVGRRRAIFASRRRKRRRLHFGRIRKRKHRSRRRVTSWWKPARRSGATYIINMYANRRNRNAGRNANSGNVRRGAIKSLVNV